MAFNATTGLGVANNILVADNTPGYPNQVVLSLSGNTWPTTYQLQPNIVDASGASIALGTAYTLSAVASATPVPYVLTAVAAATANIAGSAQAVYTGTITGGGSNAYAGRQFGITGFAASSGANNGLWQCVASTATTLTLQNPFAVAETHAGAAQDQTASAVYTGTITGGGSNAYAGLSFVVSGFVTNVVNNGTYFCTASSGTTLTLLNPAALAETHAATATAQENTAFTYVSYGTANGAGNKCVTVSATGLLTAAFKGYSDVEVSYPSFNNAAGSIASSGNIMNGLPLIKAYGSLNVSVLP